MHLLPHRWKLLSIILNGFMHMCLRDEPLHTMPPFSTFQDGRGLDHFQRGQNNNNDVKNIMNLV